MRRTQRPSPSSVSVTDLRPAFKSDTQGAAGAALLTASYDTDCHTC